MTMIHDAALDAVATRSVPVGRRSSCSRRPNQCVPPCLLPKLGFRVESGPPLVEWEMRAETTKRSAAVDHVPDHFERTGRNTTETRVFAQYSRRSGAAQRTPTFSSVLRSGVHGVSSLPSAKHRSGLMRSYRDVVKSGKAFCAGPLISLRHPALHGGPLVPSP